MNPTGQPTFQIVPFRVRAGVGIAAMLVAALSTQAQAPAPPLLTQAAEVRALTREQAAEARPVRVRGVVNWMPGRKTKSFLFADESAGIAIEVSPT